MESYGVEKEQILPFGIPIKREFTTFCDRKEIADRLGLENKRTVLVMGGGLGLGQINHIVKTLDAGMKDVQIIAVAGRNQRLENKLKNLTTSNKLVVYGFVTNIHELMEISDCIVTKPGGVTTAEILSKQKPLVIFSPLPGQENENAEFLLNAGAAVATSDVNKIPILINQIFNFEIRMRCLHDMAGMLKKPDSAQAAVRYLLNRYGK